MSQSRTCQMFETPVFEHLSRIHPVTPFVFWLPILGYIEWRAFHMGVGVALAPALFVLGVLLWTVAEYALHRYVFHYNGPRHWQRRANFIIHGVHHDYPSDERRLVMPLGVSVPLGIVFFLIFQVTLGDVMGPALFVGFASGYLAYDFAHYAIHHLPMRSRWGRALKRHHMIHHHVGMEARWGVSSPLWDWLLKTMESPAPRPGAATSSASSKP